jgi:hypothetical protein
VTEVDKVVIGLLWEVDAVILVCAWKGKNMPFCLKGFLNVIKQYSINTGGGGDFDNNMLLHIVRLHQNQAQRSQVMLGVNCSWCGVFIVSLQPGDVRGVL